MLLYKSGELGKQPEVAFQLPARWISRRKPELRSRTISVYIDIDELSAEVC